MVVGTERLCRGGIVSGRIRDHRMLFCGAFSPSRNDGSGYRRAPWVLHPTGFAKSGCFKGRCWLSKHRRAKEEELRLHLRINGCKNVWVENRALAKTEGDAELYLVHGGQTGCNSLRKPEVSEPTEIIPVRIERLDNVLREHQIAKVDFMKLDVEGAELSVLKGASQLLANYPRPMILIEVQDVRTRPWGYAASEIIRYLANSNYQWFRPLADGGLEGVDAQESEYNGNFVAVPREQLASLSARIT